MRALALGVLLVLPPSAQAMNWEGKEDWMADMEPAVIYEGAVPHATPPPDAACAAAPEQKAENNPYEQVPLPRHDCPAGSPEPGPER
jgi:hypothetical protein